MNYFKILLSLALALGPYTGASAQSVSNAGSGEINLTINPGFENGKAAWTASAGSFTLETSAPLAGAASAKFNASASSQTLTMKPVTIKAGMFGRQCQLHVPRYTLATGASTDYNIKVVDGSANVLLAAVNIPVATSSASLFYGFPCPAASTTLSAIITSAADGGDLIFDDVFVGAGRSVIIGGAIMTEWVAYTPVIVGFGTPSAVTFFSRRVGDTLEISGTFTSGTTTAVTASATMGFNGVSGNVTAANTSKITSAGNIAGSGFYSVANAVTFTVLAIDSDTKIYFGLQSASSAGFASNNANVLASSGQRMSFIAKVPIAGWTADRLPVEGMSYETSGWRVDANISGAHVDLGTSNVASYTEMTNSSLSLTNNVGMGTLAAQIPCSTTNSPTGTTCSAGSESVGVSFNLPVAGDVEACVSASWYINPNVSSTIHSSFQVVETPSNAQTILQEGKSRMPSTFSSPAAGGLAAAFPMRVCGTFSFASAGTKTLRLMYEQQIGAGSIATSQVFADAAAAIGQRDIHWEVKPINQQMPAPVFDSFRTKLNAGQANMVLRSAQVICHSSPSIVNQAVPWITAIGALSGNACQVTISSGIFTNLSDLVCWAQLRNTAADSRVISVQPTTLTNIAVALYDTAGAGGPYSNTTPVNFFCLGTGTP